MKVRKRLALLYTAVLAGLFLLFALGMYASFVYHLRAEVDESLASWSDQILDSDIAGRLLVPKEDRASPDAAAPRYEMPDAFVAAFDRAGAALLDRSAFSPGGLRALGAAISDPAGGARFRFVELEGRRYRILSKRIVDSRGESATLVLGRLLIHVERTARELAKSLAVAWALSVALGSTMMWLLVGQTIRPVNSMTAVALEIAGSNDLQARLQVGRERDEFSELARALNLMLATIAAYDEGQKQFLADASHELRTPLTSLRSNLDYLRAARGAPDDEREAALRDCLAEAERMSGLVNKLLLLARAEAPTAREISRVDVRRLVGEACQRIGPTGSLRMEADLGDASVEVVGDREELLQAVLLLLENSRKYAGPEGTVRIRVERPDRGWARILVEDDGPGIPEAELDKVLERFYRASNVRARAPGSGLGLAIVKSLVQKHEGRLRLANRSPKGLSVALELPAVEAR